LLHHYSANGYAVRYFKYDSLLHGEEFRVHKFSTYMKQPVITNSKVTIEDILEEWKNGINDEDKVMVAVDSLSPLIVNHKIGPLCKAITRLCQSSMSFKLEKKNSFNLTIPIGNFSENIHLVGLVHGDAHDEQTLKLIRHTSNCYLTVKTQDKKNFCQGVLRKPGGKIVDSVSIENIIFSICFIEKISYF
jgi:elongator complex protein 5